MKTKYYVYLFLANLLFFSCDLSNGEGKSDSGNDFIVSHDASNIEKAIRDSILTSISREKEIPQKTARGYHNIELLDKVYGKNDYYRLWSSSTALHPRADSFFSMIQFAAYYGLFSEDYHFQQLKGLITDLKKEENQQKVSYWAKADLLLSDAFISFAHDLHLGRIPKDAETLNPDTVVTADFYLSLFKKMMDSMPRLTLEDLEPKHKAYQSLRNALPVFVGGMNTKKYTYIRFPKKDSISFVKELRQRLYEDGFIAFNDRMPDSIELAQAVRLAQKSLGITIDGKPGPKFVRRINETDIDRFRRIAINLDRYKHLPDQMPDAYIFVNLPAFKLQVIEDENLVIESKVIVGKSTTRTPLLHSEISSLVTYPQWTVPRSIIFNEMIPKIKQDLAYLKRQNLMIVDKFDSVIDPSSVNWSEMGGGNFPYVIRQRQGDDNSLGVMKFNFPNSYSVYLHDTNARSLFGRENRALSHGCVRVQAWDTLARYIVSRDSSGVSVENLQDWLTKQEKHNIPVKRKLPVYLRYFTAEVGENGAIKFYDDIYGEDNKLIIKYFIR